MGLNILLYLVLFYSDLDLFCFVYMILKVIKKILGVICMVCFSYEEKLVFVICELMWFKE